MCVSNLDGWWGINGKPKLDFASSPIIKNLAVMNFASPLKTYVYT